MSINRKLSKLANLLDDATDNQYLVSDGNGELTFNDLTVSLIDSSNAITNSFDPVSTIRFDTDSGFDLTDLGSGAVKVGMNSTFKTWQVSGQDDLVALGLDTIEFVAGTGMTITTDATTDPKQIIFETSGLQLSTTDDLSEGSNNLYFTDARARNAITNTTLDMQGNKVLFGNMYATLADLPSATTYHGMFAHVHATGKAYFAHNGNWVELLDSTYTETTTTLTSDSVNQKLVYTDETGTSNDVDLSWAVDDTNLARLVSGTLNNTTGVATFTRDDSTTFTVDFSALFDDTNNYADSVSFSGGTLTIGRSGSLSDLTVNLDGRYLQSLGSVGGHTDVDITTTAPTTGQALVWDGSNFVPGDSFSQTDFDNAFALKSIDALSDVDTTTTAPATGDALVWDGSNFVPGNAVANVSVSATAPSSPEIGDVWLDEATLDLYVYYPDTNGNIWVQVNNLDVPTQLNDLTDVNLTTTPTSGQTLVWDATNNVFIPGTIQGYTTSDFNTDFAAKTTTDLTEGTNLYYTDARADARVNLQTGANLDLSSKSTTDLTEGTNLYYTDARVDTRIAATSIDAFNDVDTSTSTANTGQALVWDGSNWVPGTVSAGNFTETVTTLTGDSVNQRLQYTDESGTVNNIDLSWAVDDTNLARITSGTLNNTTGIATFTRDDATTFTVDFSALFDDTNNYADSVSFSGGTLTIGRTGSLSDLTVSLDGRYIQSLGSVGGHTDVDITTTTPSSGDALVWDGSNFVPGNATANVTVSTSAPSSPEVGDVWLDEATLDLYVYYPDTNGNIWVQVNNLDVPTQLNDLTDVDLTTLPTNGQTLIWNSTNNQFEPGTIQGYTTTDFNTDFAAKTTTDLTEGTNLYYTDARADARIALQTGANLDLSNKSTTDLSEGTNLYYTDARVDTRISNTSIDAFNDVDTSTSTANTGQALVWDGTNWVPGTVSAGNFTETLTTLTADSANSRLQYTDEAGTVNNIDLSWAVDDTNLARLTSGSLNGSTGIATFTRDDATTFTVDFSPFFDDTNLSRITSGSISGSTLTLTRDDASTIAIDVSSLIDIDSTSLVTVSGVGTNDIDFSTISGSGISGGINYFAFSYTGYAGGGYSGPAGMELGRKYLEVEFTAKKDGAIGINGINVDLNSGNVGGSASNFGGFGVGDVLGIVYDTTTREVYYSKNGGNWSPTDPNLGAGYALGGTSGTAVQFDFRNTNGATGSNISGDVATGGIGYSLAYAVPPGTTPYSGTGTAQFLMDGAAATTLSFEPGRTYIFDQSDATNLGHPLKLSETSDGTHNSGSEYTIGVTTVGSPGTAGAYTQIVVNQATPHLYYYCANHSGMGGAIATGNVIFVGQLDDVDTTTNAPTDGQALVWDAANSKFVPGDSFSQTDFDNAISLKSIDTLSDVDTTTTAPTTGDALVWDGSNFIPGSSGAAVTVSATAPTGASEGDLWLNEDTLALYAWYVDSNSSQWVHINPYIDYTKANISATAPSSPDTGDLWVDEATLDVYIYTGSAWAQVNQSNIPTELSDLVDVDATGVADGQALIYNLTNSRFEPGTIGATVVVQNTAPSGPSEGDLWYDEDNGDMFVYITDAQSNSAWVEVGGTDVINIDDLSDVDTSTNAPTNGQALVWDGTNSKWVPGTTQGYTTSNFNTDIGNTSVDALSDVDTTTAAPTNGQALVWDGTNFVPTTISLTETTTTLTADSVNQKLVYTDETGTANDVDLSWAVDDTNLARITSGTLNNTTGIATFTRDDSTTFTVDFSALFDDTNNYADSVAFSGGTLTIGRTGSLTDLTVSLDGRYLQNITGESVGDLSNVDITTAAPTDGQALIWDNANSKFVPGDSFSQTDFDTAFGNKSIQDLSDVVGSGTDTLTVGDFLLYDGSEFGLVNFQSEVNTYADTRIGLASIQDLSDVDGVDTPASGDVLLYDAGNSNFGFINLGNEINSYFDLRIATKSIDALTDVDTTTAAPTSGDALVWDGVNWIPGNATANVTVSTTAPSSPEVGDVWLDEATLDLYVYYPDTNGNIWVQVNNLDVPTQLNDLTDVDTATTAPTTGDALVWDGSNFIPQAPFSQTDFDTAFAAKTLDDLNDVNLTVAPTDGQSIVWDNANSQWIAGDSFNQTDFDNAIALKSIDVLSDVDTTTTAPVTGDALVWDGTNFIPKYKGGAITYSASTPSAPATGDIWVDDATLDTYVYNGSTWAQVNQSNIPTELSDLVDIDITGISNGQALVWDGTGQQFVPSTIQVYDSTNFDTDFASKTTDDLSEGSTNLYYTDTRVDTFLSGGTAGNIVTTGYLAGPATFTIDPAGIGDNTGTVVIAGNLQVDGTTTSINSTTLNVDDLNIVLGDGSTSAAASNGGGITLDLGSDGLATILYNSTTDTWGLNKGLNLGTNNITNIGTDGYALPTLDGTNRQVIMTDGSGTLTFEDLDTIHTEATNGTASTIQKGTPVYQTGTSGNAMTIAPADASDPAKMPAVGVLEQTLDPGVTGFVIHMGRISGVDTSAFNEGDIIYVAVGGGYTNVAPAGEGNLLQNLGRVTKVHATNGGGVVMGAGRTNAVPNLNSGNIFIGNASNQAVTASFATTLTTGLGNNSIDALSDVDTTSAAPTSGQALVWDGSNFVPGSVTSGLDIVNDTTPELGGDLDVNNRIIKGSVASIGSATGASLELKRGASGSSFDQSSLLKGHTGDRTGLSGIAYGGDFTIIGGEAIQSGYAAYGGDVLLKGGPGNGDGTSRTGSVAIDNAYNFSANVSNAITLNGNTVRINSIWWPTADGTNGQVLTTDGTGNLSFTTISGYTDSDVDTHLNVSSATANQVLSWNGSDYAWVADNNANDYADSLSFSSGTLTIGRTGSLADLTVSLDGRYLQDLTSTSIGTLSDVDITTAAPTDGQALIWDNANSKFVPGDSFSQTDFDNAIALKSIDVLSDVDTTTTAPTTGDALVWNGTNFVPGDATANITISATAPSSPALGDVWLDEATLDLYVYYPDTNGNIWVQVNNLDVPTQLNDLTDVNLTTAPTDGQALIWDNANSVFVPGDSFSQTDFDNAIALKSIDVLSDVDTTTAAPTNGQALAWDGSNFVPTTISFTETTTTLTADSVNQKLVYTDETGTANDVDLSWAVDDTNLARLTSGTVNSTTGIATFTRDDTSTFTVDFSALLDTTLSSIDELNDVDITTTAPTTGETLVWDGSNFVPGTSSSIDFGATAPSNPSTGDVWIDNANLDTYVYTGSAFAQINQSNIPSEISDLVDADTTGIANGQVLVWNSTNTQFEPGDAGATVAVQNTAPSGPSEGDLWYDEDNGDMFVYVTDAQSNSAWVEVGGTDVIQLNDLSDVDLTTNAPTDGQVLVWDNANSVFVPGSQSSSIGDLTDVDITTNAPTDGQMLSWNATTSQFVPITFVSEGSGASVEISANPPASPTAGDLWIEDTTMNLYVYYDDPDSNQWVQINNDPTLATQGLTANIATGDNPPSPAQSGDIWYNTTTGSMFVYYQDTDSSQWVEIVNPFGNPGIFELDGITPGTTGQVLTMNADSTATFNDLPFIPGDLSDLTDTTNIIPEDPAIEWNGTTATLATGVVAADLRTLIGAGTSSFDGSYLSLTDTPTIPSDLSELTDSTSIIPTDLTDLGIADGTINQVLKTDGAGNFAFANAATKPTAYSSDTAPSIGDEVAGDLWYNTTDGSLYVYYNDADTIQWVQVVNPFAQLNLFDLEDITDGTANQVLTTDGAGNATFQDVPRDVSDLIDSTNLLYTDADVDSHLSTTGTGLIKATVDQSHAVEFNRTTDTGDIVELQLAGITKATLGVDVSDNLVIGSLGADTTIGGVNNIVLNTGGTATLTVNTTESVLGSALRFTETATNTFISVEGATADAFETAFAITDPTADRTVTFKDETGTVALISDIPTDLTDLGIADGTINQVLKTDGAGNFTFEDAATRPTAYSGDTAPSIGDERPGDLWYNTTDGSLYVLFNDVDSEQWVQVVNPFAQLNLFDLEDITDGTANQVLTTDGAGNATFQDVPRDIEDLTDVTGLIYTNANVDTHLSTTGTGLIKATVDQSHAVEFNRTTDTGDIIELQLAGISKAGIGIDQSDNLTLDASGIIFNSTSTYTFNVTNNPLLTLDPSGSAIGSSLYFSNTASNTFITVEGSTADAFETAFVVTDPTADRTITFKDEDGTVAYVADIPTDLTDLGIADGTINQVLKTDGAGNFTFEDAATRPTAYMGDSAPNVGDERAGDLWFNSTDGSLYVYYEDVDSTQWTQVVNPFAQLNLFDLEDITDGTANQVLTTDGAGNATFQDVPRDIEDLTDATSLLYTDSDVDTHLSTTGTGFIKAAVDSSHVLELNRTTDRGDMIVLQQNGITEASIGIDATNSLVITSTNSETIKLVSTSSQLEINNTAVTINKPLVLNSGAGNTFLTVEGTIDDAFETQFVVTNPTADRTVTFKDEDGTVAYVADLPTALTDLGITDGTLNQLLTTDGAGNFSFADREGVGIELSDTAPATAGKLAGDLWYNTNDGSLYILYQDVDSTQWVQIINPSPDGWAEVNSNYTAQGSAKLFVDTSIGAVTITLPASPVMGQQIHIIDGSGNAATNNITVARNGNLIDGAANDIIMDYDRATLNIVYYNAANGWVLADN